AILNVKKKHEIIKNTMEIKYKSKQNRIYESGEFVKIRVSNIDKTKLFKKKPIVIEILIKLLAILECLKTSILQVNCKPLDISDYPAFDIILLNKTLLLKQA
ncbi:30443_t:CDS:1, partial [Gigaspora margarita]